MTYGQRREPKTMREAYIPIEAVLEDIRSQKLRIAKISWSPGYMKKSAEPIVSEYNGRYGVGYAIELSPDYKLSDTEIQFPKTKSSRLHLIIYCTISDETSPIVQYYIRRKVYKKGF